MSRSNDPRNLDRDDVEPPRQAWLTLCVCHREPSCWQGWVLESAFTVEHDVVGPIFLAKGLYSDRCPVCDADLFRTAASFRYEPSGFQPRPTGVPGADYES